MSIDQAYAELGLAPAASEAEVKAAWRRLVSRWHPDRNSAADAARWMQRVNRAYEQIRLSALSEGRAGPAPEATAAGDAPASEPPGRTVRRKVRLSLEEAALGCTRVLRGRLHSACTACAGRGALAPASTCTRCDGAGTLPGSLWFGWPSPRRSCDACAGAGTVQAPCLACEGQGRVSTRYQRTVRIPAGVRRGDVLCADGAGTTQGGFDGRLELRIALAPHPFFVPGDDGGLRCEMPVDGLAWLAEAWIEVPTLGGLQQMRLRRGRHVYRLRGQGLPLERRGNTRGDCVLTVQPVFPEALNEHQQALLADLVASTNAAATPPALRRWQATLQAWQAGRAAAAAG